MCGGDAAAGARPEWATQKGGKLGEQATKRRDAGIGRDGHGSATRAARLVTSWLCITWPIRPSNIPIARVSSIAAAPLSGSDQKSNWSLLAKASPFAVVP